MKHFKEFNTQENRGVIVVARTCNSIKICMKLYCQKTNVKMTKLKKDITGIVML